MWFSSVIYAGGQVATLLLAYTFFTTDGLTGAHGSYVPYVYVTSCTAGVAFVLYCVPDTRVNLTRMADVLDDAYCPSDHSCCCCCCCGDRGGGCGRYDASSRADGRKYGIRPKRRTFWYVAAPASLSFARRRRYLSFRCWYVCFARDRVRLISWKSRSRFVKVFFFFPKTKTLRNGAVILVVRKKK